MASEQVMQKLPARAAVLAMVALMGAACAKPRPDVLPAPRLVSPYKARQVWAVAPLRNESGSLQADGIRIADKLAQQLELVDGIDVVPVSRVLAAMESLRIAQLTSPKDAMKLRQTLGVDALVVGTLSAFDPYDPPKLGLALDLYSAPHRPEPKFDVRKLSSAAVDEATVLPGEQPTGQPVSTVSAFYDAADPEVRSLLQQYSVARGRQVDPKAEQPDWVPYRISMDLYTEFVSYAASSRLLRAERQRLKPSSPGSEPLS